MYSLGPNLTPTLDATGQVLVGKSDSIFIFDAKRKAKILLAYDPKAVFDEVKVLETASNDRSLYCTKVRYPYTTSTPTQCYTYVLTLSLALA